MKNMNMTMLTWVTRNLVILSERRPCSDERIISNMSPEKANSNQDNKDNGNVIRILRMTRIIRIHRIENINKKPSQMEVALPRMAEVARPVVTDRSGSSTKGRNPNVSYFVAKLSIVAIYAL